MQERGVQPRIEYLRDVVYLHTKAKVNGLSYLDNLALIMRFPIMGKDLSSLGREINPDLEVTPELKDRLYKSLLLTKMLTALNKMDSACNELLSAFNLNEQHYHALANVDFGTPIEELYKVIRPGYHYWNREGSINIVACTKEFTVKGWKHTVPHPASIASAYTVHHTQSIMMRGSPPLPGDEMEYHSVNEWIHDIGRKVGAILPKGAEDLIPTAGSMGRSVVEHEVSCYAKFLDLTGHTKVRSLPESITVIRDKGVKLNPNLIKPDENPINAVTD